MYFVILQDKAGTDSPLTLSRSGSPSSVSSVKSTKSTSSKQTYQHYVMAVSSPFSNCKTFDVIVLFASS